MIKLHIQAGVAYVWNSQDWYTLRSKYRICGALIGSAPSFPRQNGFLGLPMALSSEEAALLVEKGICELYELLDLIKEPTEQEKQEMNKIEQKTLKDQADELRKRRIEQISQKIDIIVSGKKQKLMRKGITNININKEALLKEEIDKLPAIAPEYMLVHIPAQEFLKKERRKVDIDDLKPSIKKGEGAIRYSVFKDLWKRGHHITSGSKFGSDYLVYPADPVKFHGTYMVRVVYDEKKAFSLPSIVAFGRLSVAVNKLAVFACCDAHGQIQYQTVQWHESYG